MPTEWGESFCIPPKIARLGQGGSGCDMRRTEWRADVGCVRLCGLSGGPSWAGPLVALALALSEAQALASGQHLVLERMRPK